MIARLRRCVLLLLAVLCAGPLAAAPPDVAELRVAVATNLRPAMEQLAREYRAAQPSVELKISYGSSGKIATQIRHGAPFDLFFAADEDYPQGLAEDGFGAPPQRYARGRLSLWLRGEGPAPTLADLSAANVRRIAIANPAHAPYGKAAVQTLTASGLIEAVQSRLVMAENIGQAAHFAHSGAAEAGLLAHSLLLSGELEGGRHALVDEALHLPLWQSALITHRGSSNPHGRGFLDFVLSERGRRVLAEAGFALP